MTRRAQNYSNSNGFRLVLIAVVCAHAVAMLWQPFGVPVQNGGIGIVMNGNNHVTIGPFFRDINLNTHPSITADQGRSAADADLNQFNVSLAGYIANLLQPGLNHLTQQASAVVSIQPALGIYPTADGYRLVWKVAKSFTNPLDPLTVDLDFELGTVDGQVLSNSATATANEFVTSVVQSNTTYILRVLGWASGPTTFNIVSDQLLPEDSPNKNAGTCTSGGNPFASATTNPVAGLFRFFIVNPLTTRSRLFVSSKLIT
jgi:hypothetical protein